MPMSTSRKFHRHAAFEALFGRRREQTILRGCLRDALDGRGRLVLIEGEAGIGKTTLVQALAHEADAEGAASLISACYDLTVTPPYGPWRELFTDLRLDGREPPLMASPDQHDGQRATSPDALFSDMLDFLVDAASQQPLALIFEDLQWADAASLELLRYVARQIDDVPLLLVATYRDSELDRGHPFYQILPPIVREARATRMHLRPLDTEAVRSITRGRYEFSPVDESRVVEYLQERAQGNPFFIGELLRTLEDTEHIVLTSDGWKAADFGQIPVPPLVQQVIEGRLARLDQRSRRLLAIAAVTGQNVALDIWRAVSEATQDDLSTAIRLATGLNLLEETPAPSALRFTHALVRETLYYEIELPRRCALHQAVGEALAQQPSPDPDVVSYHFQQAGHEAAAGWLMAAGERAQELYAWRTAAERFEAVLPFLESDLDIAKARGWLLYRTGLLLRYAAPSRGIVRLGEAERVAGETGEEHLAAYARADRGLIRCLVGDVRRGLAEMREGVAELDALPAIEASVPGADSGAATSRLSAERIRQGALDLIGVSTEMNIRQGSLVFWLAWAGRFSDAIAIGEQYVTKRPEQDARIQDSLGDALAGLGHAYASLGRPEESLASFARARDTYQSIDHHFKVGNTAIYELSEALLPYRADHLMEREWLAAQAEAG
jgi:tetratricopeptide (TPR) repeat protein